MVHLIMKIIMFIRFRIFLKEEKYKVCNDIFRGISAFWLYLLPLTHEIFLGVLVHFGYILPYHDTSHNENYNVYKIQYLLGGDKVQSTCNVIS